MLLFLNQSSCTSNLEQLWLKINAPKFRTQIVGNLYRPPTGGVPGCIRELRQSCDVLVLTHVDCTLLGDLNINYSLKSTRDFRLLKELERDFQLTQYMSSHTRTTSRTASTLDLILSNMTMVSQWGVYDFALSDHHPVFIIKKKMRNRKEYRYIKGRSYRKFNSEEFRVLLSNNDKWNDYWSFGNPNDAWKLMKSIILESLDELAPYK